MQFFYENWFISSFTILRFMKNFIFIKLSFFTLTIFYFLTSSNSSISFAQTLNKNYIFIINPPKIYSQVTSETLSRSRKVVGEDIVFQKNTIFSLKLIHLDFPYSAIVARLFINRESCSTTLVDLWYTTCLFIFQTVIMA